MSEEFNALVQNHAWTLVHQPPNVNIVGNKWVYRIKYGPTGSIDRFKVRLVAQGFSQLPGLDYTETFAPVIKLSTVRVVLSLALLNNWCMHQLDVSKGFEHYDYPQHVCKLSRAIYGLKQSPRAWFTRLATYLLDLGFKKSTSDHSMFTFRQDSSTLILLIYVDDIVVFGSSQWLVYDFIESMKAEFAMKDLGSLHYFLGVEIVHNTAGALLLQRKYISDHLHQFDLAKVHSDRVCCTTPGTSKPRAPRGGCIADCWFL